MQPETSRRRNAMRSTPRRMRTCCVHRRSRRAAANGVNAGAGIALTNQAQIAARGHYQAGLDLWSGQNQATGALNQAAAKRYTGDMDLIGGEEAQRAASLNALSTIAGGGASFLRMYGGKTAF